MDSHKLHGVLPHLRTKVHPEATQPLVITLPSEIIAGKDFGDLEIAHILSDRDVVGAPEFDKVHTTVPDDFHDLAAQKVQQGLEVVSCEGDHVEEEDKLGKGGPDADEGQCAVLHPQLFA